MREKLNSSRGETLVEVLASVLICALSVTLLFGAVMASGRIDLQAQAADAEYYEALSKAERQDAADKAPAEPALSVEVANAGASGANPPVQTVSCGFYGTERLLSYALTPPSGGGTGGGP
nr:hypothetical protein [uncultured Oscillibacter sp.]